jgi:hypothetical protein
MSPTVADWEAWEQECRDEGMTQSEIDWIRKVEIDDDTIEKIAWLLGLRGGHT